MKSLFHTAKTRRNVLLLFVFTILSLIFFIRLISYNSHRRQVHKQLVAQTGKMLDNLTAMRRFAAAFPSFDQMRNQPAENINPGTRTRILELLEENMRLEEDAMQQKKMVLVKKAVRDKIDFEDDILHADSARLQSGETGFAATDRRLSGKILLPLDLAIERQELLMQRRSREATDQAKEARIWMIFYAVFIYLFIIYALWQLRGQLRPGPATSNHSETEENASPAHQEKEISTGSRSGFKGVFQIQDALRQPAALSARPGVVRYLYGYGKKDEHRNEIAHQQSFEQQRTEPVLPEWKRAGLPEQLSLQTGQESGHFLGQAVNANFMQGGSPYSWQPNGFIPGGNYPYRLQPTPFQPHQPYSDGLEPEPAGGFQLNGLIQELLAARHIQAAEKNIRLLHTIDPSVPALLYGNSGRLTAILNALLQNALQFTFKGYIQLTVAVIRVSELEAEIAFSVADTGKGIDAGKMQDLLHGSGDQVPFLAQAKKLAETQQNQMMIHTTPDDGTVCCFTHRFRMA